ncbi:MAG: ABC transporter ATP-binding protein [Chloroflexi bacterium]|nr:ABC transporter ATP-binding protein [Chloroflexota bacterium]MDA8189674.1 ABC transporter ATP-binding protein [Dehalococcoidales bacterium]
MLEVRDLSFRYDAQPAIVDVSLAVQQGEFVALLGSNGAGKTTLLRIISGLLRPASGTIAFDGQRLDSLQPHRICDLGLVHVPEGRQLFPSMTVRENLELGAYLPAARRHLAASLEYVIHLFPKLGARLGQLVGTLSGGEQQMVAIGRGLMAGPRLLMLDEPTLGLSPALATEILHTVRQLNKERSLGVLLVSQDVVQALQLAHSAYVLQNGRMVRHGTAEEFLGDESLRQAYLGI